MKVTDEQVEAAAREIWGDDWPDYADAMRAALEAAAQAAPADEEIERLRGIIVSADREIKAAHADADRLRAALEAAAPAADAEPVAWLCKAKIDGLAERITRDPAAAADYNSRQHRWSVTPLYAASPKGGQ